MLISIIYCGVLAIKFNGTISILDNICIVMLTDKNILVSSLQGRLETHC